MKRLPKPDERTLRAFVKGDWDDIRHYLLNECLPAINNELHITEGPHLYRGQGAAQVLDDISELTIRAADYLTAFINAKKQREERQNV